MSDTEKKYDTDDLTKAAEKARANPFKSVKDWIGVLVLLANLIGAGFLSIYKLGELEKQNTELEAKITTLSEKVSQKADATAMRSIREALGDVQLDVALMCSEMVRARGGNPLSECQTSRGTRSR